MRYLELIVQAFKLKPYIPVVQQLEADPEFPTVPFPNPEEGKGALVLETYVLVLIII